jgi:protein-S-isoprenylcysteine O-methyltransferase Ste14
MFAFASAGFGTISYAAFLTTILYAIGFVGNLPLSKTIDSGEPGPIARAIIVNSVLLGLFAIHHSVMARPAFKRWWTRFVPQPVERATFVLFASLTLDLLFWQWRPIAGTAWQVSDPTGAFALQIFFWFGWALLFVSTFLLSHFELFGLHQIYAQLRGKSAPLVEFKTPSLYKRVGHPIYLGFLIAFWATPNMSYGHLFFACTTTAYILLGIQLEERDLIAIFGDQYRAYRQRVPMLLPYSLKRLDRTPATSPDPAQNPH